MNIMNLVIQTINASLHLYIAYVFFHSFYKCKFKRITSGIVYVVCSILLSFSMFLFRGNPVLYLIMFALTTSISLLFDGKLIFKVIYSILFLAIAAVIEAVVAITVNTAFGVDYAEGREGALFITGMLLSKFVLLMIIILLQTKKHSPILKQFKKKYYSIYLFPVSTLLIIIAQHNIFVKNPNQTASSLYFVLICYSLLMLANMIVFDFIDSLYVNTLNESKIITANEIIETQKFQYESLIQHNRHIAKIQHDNKHLFLGLISEIQNGNYDTVINSLTKAYKICEKEVDSNNNIIETLVNIKIKDAQFRGIKIEYEYRHIKDIKIAPIDIAIILGNALDNAIEACEKVDIKQDKKVFLFITLKGDALIISIKNPVSKNVNIDSLTSNKENIELHGFGVISMKQIADKYDGEVTFKCENGFFSTTILLKNSTT